MRQTVLITGALGGIGRALCKVFKERGWRVIGMDIRMGDDTPYCDVSINKDLSKFCVDAKYRENHLLAIKEFAGENLCALVNNAAIQLLDKTDDIKIEEWQETLNVNLTGPMLLSQAMLPVLEKNQGSIINIASIHQQLTKPRFVSYATSKSALVGLTKAMAVDVEGRININCISPAAIETDMLRAGFNNDENAIQALRKLHPAQRIGYPEEVAKLAVFLTSDEAKFINGANLQLDGGISSVLHDL